MTDLVHIPFHGEEILAVNTADGIRVVLKPVIEQLGLDWSSQLKRLNRSSWAQGVVVMAIPSAGGMQQATVCDVRTLTMLLATVEESRVSENVRPLLVAYQREAADVLAAHFTGTSRAAPLAGPDYRMQMDVIRSAQGVLAPAYLELKAKIVLGRAMGEKPDVDPLDVTLGVEDYIRAKGLRRDEAQRLRSPFGRRLAQAFRIEYGRDPESAPGEVGARVRSIKHYTERDRPLFDLVWDEHYADLYTSALSAATDILELA